MQEREFILSFGKVIFTLSAVHLLIYLFTPLESYNSFQSKDNDLLIFHRCPSLSSLPLLPYQNTSQMY